MEENHIAFKMNYKITNWNGKKDFKLKLTYKGYELVEVYLYRKELELNLRHQIKWQEKKTKQTYLIFPA